MPNGNGLLGGQLFCQPVVAVPFINDPDKYYIFTVGWVPPLPDPIVGLHYSVLDMQLDGGLGDIVPGIKNIPLPMGDSAVTQLTAIRHHNNKDAWVVVLRHGEVKEYLAYLIDSSGICTTPVVSQSTLTRPIRRSGSIAQFMKISPDGQYLACNDSVIELCLFNSSTGVVTPKFFFMAENSQVQHGMEFSIESKFLYVSSSGQLVDTICSPVAQYDMSNLDSLTFIQNRVHVGDSSGANIQMAPDGKIYLTHWWGKDYLNVINYPSNAGPSCQYQKNVIYLEGNWNYQCLPQFLQRYKLYIHYSGHCQNDSIRFSADIWPPPDSIHWDFGDPGSGAANFSNDTTPTHIYTTPGNYTVELFVRHIDKRTDTAWITISIDQTPQPLLGPDQTICEGDSVTFDAGFCNGCTFQWDNLLTGQLNIGNEQTFTAYDSGIYAVTVTSPYDCLGRDTVQLAVVTEATVIVVPVTLAICSGDTTDLTLQCNVSACDFSWTAVGSSPLVTGYSPGSGDFIQQTLFNNDTIDQTVTYTITPASPYCTGIPSDYPVVIHPLPDVWFDPPVLTVCSGQAAIINLYSHVAGATFSWTAIGSSGDVTGFSDGSGSVINQVLQNTGNTSGYVTYLVTPTGGEGCMGTPGEYIVTVLPVVEATVSPPVTILCSGDTTDIHLQCNLAGCTFSWSATASSPFVTGYSSGTGDSIQQALFNSDTVDQTVTYSIVPSVSGCGADTTDYSVLIHPRLPVSVTIAASINPVCGGIPVTFTATPVHGGTDPFYQWQVNAIDTGTNNVVFTYTPSNGDVVTCILTSDEDCVSGNPATSNPITMSVGEQPDVSFSICFDTLTTLNAQPFKLKGGIPLGGTYSGPGVDPITGYFHPAIAGVGAHTIAYTYTNFALCSDVRYRILDVRSAMPFSCGDTLVDIRDGTSYPTVQIGSQCWMAANLSYGLEIPDTLHQRDNCIPEKYSPPSSFVPRPSFYQWDELMCYEEAEGIQGLCPPGWHVPSEADWNLLFANWINNAFAGRPLLYSGFSGFNALLSGIGLFNRSWNFIDFAAMFWSSTAHGPWKAWSHGLNDYNYSVSYYPSYRANAFSIRCLLD
ncbi:MAG: PKD domain-containing protein [Bacteroidales bacterium]|nr:PKD domain-containing protein [Bacteroidales bacterium]